jgi:hypothetical protein
MNKLTLLLLLLLPTLALAQTKGDNLIQFKTSLSDQEAYMAIGHKLLELNFTFKGDDKFLFIKTDHVSDERRPWLRTQYTIIVHQGAVKIFGLLSRLSDKDFSEWSVDYRPSGLAAYGDAFPRMQELVAGLKGVVQGGELTYSTR